MPRSSKLPSDWKERVKKEILDHQFPFMQTPMLLLLQKSEVETAAEILWKAAEGLPEIRKDFHIHLHDALFELAVALSPHPRLRRTSREWRDIVKAMETVRDDNLCFRDETTRVHFPDGTPLAGKVYIIGPEARVELERAIIQYRSCADHASKTKPKDPGPRYAMRLRSDFRHVFGNFLDEAVGLFLGAAFGGRWDAATVRARASEWKE